MRGRARPASSPSARTAHGSFSSRSQAGAPGSRRTTRLRAFHTGAWSELDLPANGTLSTLGINASADTTNRLAVSAPATLFNNAGNGHQIKINKSASGDTASMLFQTGWSGRAEMGLAGNDAFSIKVSPDGGAWQTGLTISPQGVVALPCQPLVRASLAAGAVTPTGGSSTGFTQLSVNRGGFSLGTSLGTTIGNRLVVPADGLYLLLLSCSILTSSGHAARIIANGTDDPRDSCGSSHHHRAAPQRNGAGAAACGRCADSAPFRHGPI